MGVTRLEQGDENGQATVAFVAMIPALVVVGLVLAQSALIGYAAWSAAGSARAAARADLVGSDPERAARAALPGLLERRSRVLDSGSRRTVEVIAPRVLPILPELRLRAAAGLNPEPGDAG